MSFPRSALEHRTRCGKSARESRGSVLLLVLVAIVIMTLTTTSYLLVMRNEHLAARHSNTNLQAQMLAESGLDYLRVFLDQPISAIELQGGLRSNPASMQDILVIDDTMPSYRGRFTVIAPEMVEGYYQGVRYGLEDESAKLNLNLLVSTDASTASESSNAGSSSGSSSAGSSSSGTDEDPIEEQTMLEPSERLLLIPGMTDEVADAILDWIDDDDETRPNGAEADYYQSLSQPYQPANRPLKHLDELLQVRGVTRELLYGLDTNRNHAVEAQEQFSALLQQFDNTTGQLNRGLAAYLTVVSAEANVTAEGEARFDLNGEDLESLHGDLLTALGPAEANYIAAFRQFGGAEPGSGGPATSADSVEIDFEQPGEQQIASLLDLVDSVVTMTNKSGRTTATIESPWKSDDGTIAIGFAELLDIASISTEERISGRINVNQASRAVLLTVPGMTEILADQILASRNVLVDRVSGNQRHAIWLLSDGLVTLEEFKPMYDAITTGGDVHSCQIVGFFEEGTATARIHAILDRSSTSTKVLSWKDLQALGPGFPNAVLSNIIPSQP